MRGLLEKKYANLYARSSGVGLREAERDIILTYFLHVLSTNILSQLAFKGGTCLKKTYFGKTGRFSMDLDFTSISISLEELPDIFYALIHEKIHYKISFKIVEYNVKPESYFAVVEYSHTWNAGDKFEFQVSFREQPILSPIETQLVVVNYFKYLQFQNVPIRCLQKEELLAEKIRATFQRIRSRDLYDLYQFTERPINRELLKTLVVLKCWNARDPFDAEKLFETIRTAKYDWDDLQRLVRRDQCPPQEKVIRRVLENYDFLRDLEEDHLKIVKDSKTHKKKKLIESLTSDINKKFKLLG